MKEFIVRTRRWKRRIGSGSQGNTLPPPLGIIEVIHAASIVVNVSRWRGILSVATPPSSKKIDRLKKRLRLNRDPITFDEDDPEGTS